RPRSARTVEPAYDGPPFWNCVSDKLLPSGSLNQATFASEGDVQIVSVRLFAPASPDRARVVPRTRAAVAGECGEASVTDRQRALALTWAQRLKRVFAIEIETC